MIANQKTVVEILEFLKTKLEIPDNVIGLTLHLKQNSVVTVECEYLPSCIHTPTKVEEK
jgi:hypothetical protein